jgi:hypothetical protein
MPKLISTESFIADRNTATAAKLSKFLQVKYGLTVLKSSSTKDFMLLKDFHPLIYKDDDLFKADSLCQHIARQLANVSGSIMPSNPVPCSR